METKEGMRLITLADLQTSVYHQEFIYTGKHNSSGRYPRVRVNGAPKLWKTRPESVRVPYKYGLYEYGYLTESDLQSKLWYTTAHNLNFQIERGAARLLPF
jgi:hypothetical protein